MVCSLRNHFKKHEHVYKIVIYLIFSTLNSSEKRKILLFFNVADWDTMGRVIT